MHTAGVPLELELLEVEDVLDVLELVIGLGNVPELDDVLVVTPDQLELLEVEDVLDVLELVELLEVDDVLVPLLDVPWNIF